MQYTRFTAARLLPLVLAGCAGELDDPAVRVERVPEAFVTRSEVFSNMDSPAVWSGVAGTAWLIATGKTTDRLYVYDAATGAPIRTVGQRGTGPGEFRRPNGIAVVDDLALIVERDNRRIQVLRLPGFEHVLSFGADRLVRPYGIAVLRRDSLAVELFVTDDYRTRANRTPPDRALGERVKRYSLSTARPRLVATYLGAFGDTVGAGRLRKVESLAVDAAAGIVLIADEEAGNIKVYDVAGSFTGHVLWGDVIRHDPEGIALYACDTRTGYWIVADQHARQNRFLVFHRTSFELVGAFTGGVVTNTDGVALIQKPIGAMTAGALYAVHNDRAVASFSWRAVAGALSLRHDCASEEGAGLQVEPLLLTARVRETDTSTE